MPLIFKARSSRNKGTGLQPGQNNCPRKNKE